MPSNEVLEVGRILRAKSKKERNPSLKDHINETIKRAIELKKFVDENKSSIDYNGFNEEFFKNLVIACFLHDLGKINPTFQKKVFDEEERQYKDGEYTQIYSFFKDFNNVDLKDHEVVSVVVSSIFLENDDWAKKIRTAILLHHYNNFYVNEDRHIASIFNDYPDLGRYLDFLLSKREEIKELFMFFIEEAKKENSNELATKTLDELKNKINLDKIEMLKHNLKRGHSLSNILQLFEIPDREDESFYDFFVFLGALRRCDYSASGDVEIEKIVNVPRKVYGDLENEIDKKIGEKGYFWQKEILQKYDSKNMVLVAPTGSGKTEFALLWAKNRGKKLLYTLPLRVALNDLYWRFNRKEEGYFEEEFLRVLHSTSFIEYLKENKSGESLDVETKEVSSELFASPLLLTTPDQVFLSCLKYYGFDKLINVYPMSAIVLDEIQTYNPEMAAIIIKTLEIVRKLNGNILVMTATLPPYFTEFLNKENGFQVVDLENESRKNKVKNYSLKRHKVFLIEEQSKKQLFIYREKKSQEKEEILEIDKEAIKEIEEKITENKNKNILIIVNNVGKAIELFKKIEENSSNLSVKKENLYLLHSRLLEKEKSNRINEIKEKLKNKNERIVLIATQIVEASVDVDFDLLITEISPIDSQIQRWGRVYRNRENDYSESSPNIFIFTGIDKGTSAIYDKQVVEKTLKALKELNKETVLDYEQERNLINEVFDKTLKETYIQKIRENLEWLKYTSLEKRSEAQRIFRRIAGLQFVIPELMRKSENEIEKAFGEVIEDTIKRDENKLTWESIVEKVKEKVRKDEDKRNVNKFELKKILYLYSVNVPIFSFGDDFPHISRKEFKGFQILREDNINQELCDIEKYGINKIYNIDIDQEEIKESEDYFII